jgi:hypothetical protein
MPANNVRSAVSVDGQVGGRHLLGPRRSSNSFKRALGVERKLRSNTVIDAQQRANVHAVAIVHVARAFMNRRIRILPNSARMK